MGPLFQGVETGLELVHGGSSSVIGMGSGVDARSAGDPHPRVGMGASVRGAGAGVNQQAVPMAPRVGVTSHGGQGGLGHVCGPYSLNVRLSAICSDLISSGVLLDYIPRFRLGLWLMGTFGGVE